MNGSTVVVTGATGFVGGAVARRLSRDGARVVATVRATSRADRVAGLAADGIECAQIDDTYASLAALMRRVSPDTVFHLAARVIPAHMPEDTASLVDANVRFGAMLLEAMSTSSCRRIVVAGTMWQHFEDREYSPMSLYAATKQAFEAVLQYYVEMARMRAVVLDLADVYGPGDDRKKLVVQLDEAVRTGTPVALTAGDQFMHFVHVDDAAAAFRHAAARLDVSAASFERWAVRGKEVLSLREFVHIYERLRGTPAPVVWGARPYRERERFIPWRSGTDLPQWEPQIAFEDGLRALLAESR
ncbi:MAG: NAD(P)-dependent oxidoreductase [Gemmatimonadetes bacterium]|nr:NAD(P)-dependent oxidoreductase [Gemmatimonadota bacterium]